MKPNLKSALLAGILLLAGAAAVPAQDQPAGGGDDAAAGEFRRQLRALNWVKGPQQVDLFGNSALELPPGYLFLGTADTAKLEALERDLSSGNRYFLAPADFHWQAFFSYRDDGYVKDDAKIDADAILRSIRDGTEQANRERRERGFDEMEVTGWQTPPYYDPGTHHLEWAIRGRNRKTGEEVVNFNTRILGRGGVMSVVLISAPEMLAASISELQEALRGFDYRPGQKYAEYRPGDKVAEYGLAALITGGAAAVAVKTGLWKVLLGALVAGWKFVAAAAVALASFVTRLFRRKSA